MTLTEQIRDILKPIFPQEKKFEKSQIPIYTNYSLSYQDIDTKRIIIYQGNSLAPQQFIGNKEIIRSLTFDILVACKDIDEGYNISNQIFNYLRKYVDGSNFMILPMTDIDTVGFNQKKFYIYTCSYGILKK
jgi:hypothetical protein